MGKIQVSTIAAVLALSCGVQPALAQDSGVDAAIFDRNRLMSDNSVPFHLRDANEQTELFRHADNFGRCAVSKGRELSEEMMEAYVTEGGEVTGEEERFFERLKNCATKRVTADRNLLFGVLSTHLLLDEGTTPDLRPVRKQEELQGFMQWVPVGDSVDSPASKLQLGYQCRAAIMPSVAMDVLKAEASSPEQELAVTELTALTQFCDPMFEGVETTSLTDRVFIARALYHWTQYRASQL